VSSICWAAERVRREDAVGRGRGGGVEARGPEGAEAGLDEGQGVGVRGGKRAMSGAATFACLSLLGSTLVRPLVAVLGAPIGRLGVAGALARQNAARAPRRTASTAIALTVGLALVMAMTVVATSMKASVSDVLDRANPADLILKADSQLAAGIPTAAATRLRTLPEVGVVSPMRFAQTGDQRLRLVGTYTDTTLLGAGYLVGIGTFAANVSENLDIAVLVTAADGVGVAALKQAVRTALADYPNVAVQDTQEFNASQGRSVDQLLGLVNVLLALAVLIALLGVVNTLALSVLERTRELGLLRAVGMTRRQVRRAVRWEAVLVAAIGAVIGLALGLAVGAAAARALAGEGITVLRVPLGQPLLYAVLAAAAGVLAAITPARRAARVDILRAVVSD
jgi:putative ABC transport system permease protein